MAPTALMAFIIPPINFFLMGLLLTGRVIVAYHDAFEGPLHSGFDSTHPRPDVPGKPGDKGEFK